MAFSFGAAGTPAFGAQPAPAFGAAGTPAFGAVSTPAFGATSAPAFGFAAAAPASSPSLFGASSAPSFSFGGGAPTPFGGGAVASTPAFSFAGAPAAGGGGLFGATPAPAFGASGTGALTLFQSAAAGTTTLFGAAAQPAAAAPPYQALLTKEGRPLTHTTKWEDLSPQAQQYLLDLEKVVVQYREECRQLDADRRLLAGGGREQRQGVEEGARALGQGIAALGSVVAAGTEQADGLREVVMHLVRATETALHTFRRSHAWREAAKASQGQALPAGVVEELAGAPVLPSPFLREAVAGFAEKLRQHQAAVAELGQLLALQPGGGMLRGNGGRAGDGLQALQSALTNMHDSLIHGAARLQALDDRVMQAKEQYLAKQRAAGDYSDPFAEEERRTQQKRESQPKSAAQAAPSAAAQQQLTQGAPQPAAAPAFAATPGFTAPGAAAPTGLFGAPLPTPGAGFGTPLFDQSRSVSAKKSGSRKR